MKLKNKINLIVLGIAFLPLGITFWAGGIASLAHCQLDEGSIHECYILGHDFGELLYDMGVIGWFSLFLLPLAIMFIIGNNIYWWWESKRK